MDQTKPKYNRRVLMGGWFEENCEEEYQMAVYMKKRERKSLFTHQVKRVFENFLKAIQLPLPTKGVIYGGIIQLIGECPVHYRTVFLLELPDLDIYLCSFSTRCPCFSNKTNRSERRLRDDFSYCFGYDGD